MTLEPDGTAAACKAAFPVGSTPTGVFLKQATMDVSRPAARPPSPSVSRLGVFRTWALTRDASIVVSSEVEHQTLNLEVAGSTPVPHRRLTTCSGQGAKASTKWPAGGG